jgi:hypothetical protein
VIVRVLLATVLYASLAVPIFAEAAGWVLIRPPLDENGNLIRNAPVNSWGQASAFDSATQCEQQRMAEINGWKSWLDDPQADLKGWLREFVRQQWMNSVFDPLHALRFMVASTVSLPVN